MSCFSRIKERKSAAVTDRSTGLQRHTAPKMSSNSVTCSGAAVRYSEKHRVIGSGLKNLLPAMILVLGPKHNAIICLQMWCC